MVYIAWLGTWVHYNLIQMNQSCIHVIMKSTCWIVFALTEKKTVKTFITEAHLQGRVIRFLSDIYIF